MTTIRIYLRNVQSVRAQDDKYHSSSTVSMDPWTKGERNNMPQRDSSIMGSNKSTRLSGRDGEGPHERVFRECESYHRRVNGLSFKMLYQGSMQRSVSKGQDFRVT